MASPLWTKDTALTTNLMMAPSRFLCDGVLSPCFDFGPDKAPLKLGEGPFRCEPAFHVPQTTRTSHSGCSCFAGCVARHNEPR